MSETSREPQEGDIEPCIVCGKDVRTQYPGLPRARALCDRECIKVWCERTGATFLTMEEYAERRRRERGYRVSSN